jgi:Family of unknown function (DUF6082)
MTWSLRRRRAPGVESRIQIAVRVATITLLAAVGTIALSPLILAGLSEIPGVMWAELSTIGQSYNGISAVLAAAALIGAVATVRLQARQSLVQQEHAIRGTQFELLKLALENDDLLATTQLRIPDSATRTQRRQHIYLSMALRHIQFIFVATAMPIRTLELVLKDEFMGNAHALTYWPRVRDVWRSQLSEGRPRLFVDTVDRVFEMVSSVSLSQSGPTRVRGVFGGHPSSPAALDDTEEMNERVDGSSPPPELREPSATVPDAAGIRRALAECMTVSDIDDAMGWAPDTARRRRWHDPTAGGLPPADAELAGTPLWFRATISRWRALQQDTRPPVAPPSAEPLPAWRDEAIPVATEQAGPVRAPERGGSHAAAEDATDGDDADDVPQVDQSVRADLSPTVVARTADRDGGGIGPATPAQGSTSSSRQTRTPVDAGSATEALDETVDGATARPRSSVKSNRSGPRATGSR